MIDLSGLQEETVIAIPGLKRDIAIFHLTDSHLSEADGRDDAVVREFAAKRNRSFREIGLRRHLPADIFREHIRICNEERADFAVFTGDIVDFPSSLNLETMREGYSRLGMPYVYTLGNHDWSYHHLPIGDDVRERAYPLFGDWMDGIPGCRALDTGEVILIAVDNSNYQVTDGQAEFVRSMAGKGRPCLLFMHIPLYVPSLEGAVRDKWGAPIMMGADNWTERELENWRTRKPDASTAAFRSWLLSSGDGSESIRGLFCGHVHFSHTDPIGGGRRQYVTAPGFAGGSRLIRLTDAGA